MAVGDAHVFPGFLTPALTQLFFLKPNDKIMYVTKLKAFAADKIDIAQMMISVFDRLENIVARSYHGSRWRICASWLPHSRTNTTFLSKTTDYFSHMLLQRWDGKIHWNECLPQPGIKLTTTRSRVTTEPPRRGLILIEESSPNWKKIMWEKMKLLIMDLSYLQRQFETKHAKHKISFICRVWINP